MWFVSTYSDSRRQRWDPDKGSTAPPPRTPVKTGVQADTKGRGKAT